MAPRTLRRLVALFALALLATACGQVPATEVGSVEPSSSGDAAPRELAAPAVSTTQPPAALEVESTESAAEPPDARPATTTSLAASDSATTSMPVTTTAAPATTAPPTTTAAPTTTVAPTTTAAPTTTTTAAPTTTTVATAPDQVLWFWAPW